MKPVGELYEEVDAAPYNKEHREKLIDVLRLNKSHDYVQLYEARLNKFKYFMISEQDVADTLEDLMTIKDEEPQKLQLLDDFYRRLIAEYPTTYYWAQYIEFCERTKAEHELQDILIKALGDTVYDFEGSKIIWDKTIGFALETYGKSGDEDDLVRVWKLILKRLSYPHLTLSESFESTSSFVSKFFGDEYDELMKTALKVYGNLSKDQRYFEVHEMNISSNPSNPEVWKAYMSDVCRYAKDLTQVSTIFYRSLVDADENWVSVWIKYIYCLYSKSDNEEYLKDILPKFVRAYPNSCISYGEYIRNIEVFEQRSNEVYADLKGRTEYLDLKLKNNYDDWKVLALSMLAHESHLQLSMLDESIEKFFKFAVDENRDIFHSVERLAILIYESRDQIDDATNMVDKLVSTFPDQSELWLFAFEFYKKHNFRYEKTSELFHKAIGYSDIMDWPEKVIQEQLIYELVYGNIITYRKALLKADETMTRIMMLRIEEEEEEQQQQEQQEQQNQQQQQQQQQEQQPVSLDTPTEQSPLLHKRRLEHESDHPTTTNKKPKTEESNTRNREEFSVKVTNLGPDITESMITSVFQDCGEIKEIIIYLTQGPEAFEAIIEFDNIRAVLAALTKTHKTIGDHQIQVKRLMNSIIWVTNFPPSYDESDIKQVFSQIGIVVSVRFPRQTSTKARRFCYVEFSDPDAVKVAISQLNGSLMIDKLNGKSYKLIVKVSENKQETRKPPVFKREVYICNIDFQADQEEIKLYFEDCGSIETVVLPLNPNMKHKGNKNGGFGFVVFNSETSVNEALKKNGSHFKGRIINVYPSKKATNEVNGTNGGNRVNGANRANNKGELNDFDNEKSVVVLNVDPRTIKEQLEVLLHDSIEISPEKLKLLPDLEAAIIQFKTVSDTGKAALKLETLQFKDRTLKVGTKADLDAKKSVTAPLMVPTSVRRKRN